ncbi:SCO2525 family SAM-dependent methyltransferase [Kibdelosporangium philippinense]|uniref:SCO2525 family SAM-dependent methyltransferase n=1 Tax=Kibdelosporangium philippinense TaxID=211113 RepID=A0ABS8ZX75_9PSEU|nr:SCO2525 family SAM-dependent methyltransferase [Kibdelosporangium philippinense]MCE7011028.1 SCO2525 family SAM-dependent methyltransferase [Kibdelosporangium philippinense]
MGPRGVGHNADFDWDDFDPDAYYAHNYRQLRDDDRYIIERVRDHFADAFGDQVPGRPLRGIDVGTGSNLYPALTMLPFCAELTLFERSQNNVLWLKNQKSNEFPSWVDSWCEFWKVLEQRKAYREVGDPPAELAARMEAIQGNVYELKADPPYDLGTMFFVAESITEEESEFRSGMDHFLDALRPGAPFAIAFMEHSSGYAVADLQFPATDIDRAKVDDCLKGRVQGKLLIERIGRGDKPVRNGYTGMLIALGRVNSKG